jgi:multidrug efflux pump
MRLWMSPEKLAAYGLTPLDVQAALNRENVELPTGRLEGDKTELTVRALGRLTKPEDFEQMILREDAGRVIRFRDVGRAELYPENERTVLRARRRDDDCVRDYSATRCKSYSNCR